MHKNLKNISISMIVLGAVSSMYAEAGAANPNGRTWGEYIQQKAKANLSVGANARALANEKLQAGNAAVAAENQKKAAEAAAKAYETSAVASTAAEEAKEKRVQDLLAEQKIQREAAEKKLADLNAKHTAALAALGASAYQAAPAANAISSPSTKVAKTESDITTQLGSKTWAYLSADTSKGNNTGLKAQAIAEIGSNVGSAGVVESKDIAKMKGRYMAAATGGSFDVPSAWIKKASAPTPAVTSPSASAVGTIKVKATKVEVERILGAATWTYLLNDVRGEKGNTLKKAAMDEIQSRSGAKPNANAVKEMKSSFLKVKASKGMFDVPAAFQATT